jgi:DNA-binding NarL/FixJ family response regulator
VAEARSADEALTLFRKLSPDIVVMDISLPGVTGIEAMRRMLKADPDSRVLMFSMHEDLVYADRALAAGAFGYVTKASAPDVLVDAVQAVAQGRKFLSPDIAQGLALRQVPGGSNAGHGLSGREFEILRLLVEGHPLKDIADSLGVSPKTIANHQSIIRQKLGAETPVQMLRLGEVLLNRPRRPG